MRPARQQPSSCQAHVGVESTEKVEQKCLVDTGFLRLRWHMGSLALELDHPQGPQRLDGRCKQVSRPLPQHTLWWAGDKMKRGFNFFFLIVVKYI